ncbi:MAG: signal recognition particle-docking protein FtsY [Burkholderiales bacterium]|jgi:fused signal recognition particle receptor|nr:signal recognition particle-docking protein FtsY [Burkholderiales bacterium]
MFDFLRRKKKENEQVTLPENEPQEAADGATAVPEQRDAEDVAALRQRTWHERLASGLSLSSQRLATTLTQVFTRKTLDDDALETLETALLTSDVGVPATMALLEDLQKRYAQSGGNIGDIDVKALLREAVAELLKPLEVEPTELTAQPCVVMLAGVNGAGKTTSIGKLTRRWQNEGFSVLLAAGDTFRAAAKEQLSIWGARNEVTVIAQQGGDPAAVMFDAVQAARARGIDIVLADTAGRLPTQAHLMKELEKIKRVIGRAQEGAPHEIWLVLDANTGQNALAQVKAFDAAVGLSGLIVTKLDGSAKGGVLAAIARECPVPVKFIGVGEGIDDLQPFSAKEFAEALLS